MAFTVPQFPSSVDFWLPGNPTSNPPDVSDVCQLYVPPKEGPVSDGFGLGICLIRLNKSWWANIAVPTVTGIFAVPDYAGNIWYYKALAWETVHQGFPNAYVEYVVQQCKPSGVVPDPAR